MWGVWVAHLVKLLLISAQVMISLFGFGFKPHIRLHTGNVEPAWDFLFTLSAPPLLDLSFSVSQKKKKKIRVQLSVYRVEERGSLKGQIHELENNPPADLYICVYISM